MANCRVRKREPPDSRGHEATACDAIFMPHLRRWSVGMVPRQSVPDMKTRAHALPSRRAPLESFVLSPTGLRFWFTNEVPFVVGSVACTELEGSEGDEADLALRPTIRAAWAPGLAIESTAAPDLVEDVRGENGGKSRRGARACASGVGRRVCQWKSV